MKINSWLVNTSGNERVSNCEIHGKFKSLEIMRNIWSKCYKCGLLSDEKEKKENEEKERCDFEKKLDRAFIPARFKSKTLQNFVADTEKKKQALDFCVRYANEFISNYCSKARLARNCVFIGSPGTGKTHLSVGIGNELLKRNIDDVYYFTAINLVRSVRESWSSGSRESESSIIKKYGRCSLLVLDEVGVQYGTDSEKTILFDILNARYENMVPTIVISNLDMDGITHFLGDRIIDRLREDNGGKIIFDWQSNRI